LNLLSSNAKYIALLHLESGKRKGIALSKVHSIKEPWPPRDDNHFDGFQWLQGSDKLRTKLRIFCMRQQSLLLELPLNTTSLSLLKNLANSLVGKTSIFVSFFMFFLD
jgi:hypothetical protein